jgi:hypothetical protein
MTDGSAPDEPHAKEPHPAGSGTTGPDTEEKRQAGSYGRDAEQDPAEAPASTSEEREQR